jgi:hypothetical protein
MNEKVMENLKTTALYLGCIYNYKLQEQKCMISITLQAHFVTAALRNADFTLRFQC